MERYYVKNKNTKVLQINMYTSTAVQTIIKQYSKLQQ